MDPSKNCEYSGRNELIGFILAAITAVLWVTGSVGVQGLNKQIPHFELNIFRLLGKNLHPFQYQDILNF